MKRINNTARISDALYNLSPNSGSTAEYNQGIMIGAVSVLLAQGMTFGQAMSYLVPLMPKDARIDSIPASWRDDKRIKESIK